MSDTAPRIAIFPGTFDPLTNGHMDIIRRGCAVFDELVVAIGHNPGKEHLFTQDKRAEMVRQLIADMPNVRVDTYTGLTVQYAQQIGATAILRGIRSSSDLHFEFQLALTNREVAGVETVFIMASGQYAFTSSSLIKQVVAMGGDISSMVPPPIAEQIRALGTLRPQEDAHLDEQ